ncbi:FAD binding domain-containing protein [Pseudonocardia spinosispora]|uniref:FAD binding domain-containing protein n=1 Tax=Pseudonocardia spinosispora TaxID=103441 RepID=UPI00040C7B1E|nr:FAD binding domain-containing protein [Pseudonocardia spinosispora]
MPTLIFQPQDYLFPATVDEVLRVLDARGSSAQIIAGGTTIHELAYRKAMGEVRTLVDVTRLPLGTIASNGERVHVGATVTFTDLARHVRAGRHGKLAVLTDAIAGIRPMQIRNVATVGGSIASSLPFFDLPAALVALDARVTTLGLGAARRTTPIEQFFWDFFLPDLRFGEMVTEVEFSMPPPDSGGAFMKFETNSVDWALVSIGVQARVRSGRFTDVRIALGGGVGRKVTRAISVERLLIGRPATAEEIERAAAAVSDDVRTFSDFRGSSRFRNHLLKVYITRCLVQAVVRAQ